MHLCLFNTSLFCFQTNREEKLLNLDCQIRGKADIQEALSTMTEVEIMEGSNKVFCDRCKKNTDTVLRSAISTLPNMLILSLKRFDLDFNTFETVKLNSRCAFGQTLNMKRYTLEGLEIMEKAGQADVDLPTPMETEGRTSDPPDDAALGELPDEDYEYKLAGVLVHAGVAQGGHYYSFIKDRNPGSEEKWYRFDDEDVTPFDPSSIEVECFGGKVKKETKWPNGQVHTVESEQYANALMLFYEKVRPSDTPEDKAEESDDKKNEDKRPLPKDIEMTSGFDVFEPDVQRSNAAHRWQTFLFDAEFQNFLKGLLGLCRLSSAESRQISPQVTQMPESDIDASWRASVVQMLLAFVFDILLYCTEKSTLGDWVRMLEETLSADRSCARNFVHKLAVKTKEVSTSWLRTYMSDCPDQVSRTAAVRIFSAACQAAVSTNEEQRELERWTSAWNRQIATLGMSKVPLPCTLEGEWASHENLQGSSSPGVSSLGVILSFLNVLLEASPRSWRHNPELCLFIRNLAGIDPQYGGDIVRSAMISSQMPARLTCLVVRERAPAALRAAFPGSSVSIEVAETQMRAEQNPTSHMMSLSGQVLNPSEMNYRGGGSPIDHLPLFEAVGCLLGLRGVIQAPLVIETEETPRGRQRIALSDQAAAALREVFEESKSPGAIGLGHREIEVYLSRCGVDSASVPPQKIVDIMAKYPTTGGGNGSKGASYLSLEGFLAYYRDTAQTNEVRVSVYEKSLDALDFVAHDLITANASSTS
jgi:ubiquitin carboxyl-terminal hydrolase 9/24